MSTLTGKSPKDTYKGLIKTSDNDVVNTEKTLTDGDGNALPMSVSPTAIGLSGDVKDNNGNVGQRVDAITDYKRLEWASKIYTFTQTVIPT